MGNKISSQMVDRRLWRSAPKHGWVQVSCGRWHWQVPAVLRWTAGRQRPLLGALPWLQETKWGTDGIFLRRMSSKSGHPWQNLVLILTIAESLRWPCTFSLIESSPLFSRINPKDHPSSLRFRQWSQTQSYCHFPQYSKSAWNFILTTKYL